MQWKRAKNIGFIFVLFLGLSGVAQAGPFTDEMSKCLVNKTTEAEKTLFVRWMYAGMSEHPVHSLSQITMVTKENISKDAAQLVESLLSVRCKLETQQSMKFEGTAAFTQSFELLGRAAMQELLSDPNVQGYFSGLDKYLDSDEMKKITGRK